MTRKQSCKDDSIGALDEEGDEGHFIAMDQLRETKGVDRSGVQTDIKKNHVERNKKGDERTKDAGAHRPSDPLLTTSTKLTGI